MSIADKLPINWGLIKNPLNWIIIILMVAIAGMGAKLILSASRKGTA